MTKEIKHAWKVVRPYDSKLRSAIQNREPQYCLNYSIRRWTRPTAQNANPFIFVFQTRKLARNFSSKRCDTRVFKCKVINANTRREGTSRGGERFISENFPDGTLFADAVKLIN